MNDIQSDRLRLIPLLYSQLLTLLESRATLETSIGLAISYFELDAADSFRQEFTEAITHYVLPLVEKHPQHYVWFTHWLIVDKELNLTVGGIGSTGLPDENGQVMIGYFIDKKFEGQGVATEAVQVLVNWMLHNPDLKTVIADTPEDHIASQRVLQKNGFVLSGRVEEGLRWQYTR